MLKFADLSVDFKSYENSFDSLMKLIPGSYYPLLIMYLAHKGMLKLELDFNKNDPCTLVSVDGKSLNDFFGEELMKNVIQKGPDFDEKSDFETAYRKLEESILKDRDIYVMLPFIHLLPMILAGKSVALVADVPEDDQFLDLVKYLGVHDSALINSSALLFFSMMLMLKYGARDYDNDNTLSEEEVANFKRIDLRIWVEDFEHAMNKITSYSNNKDWIQPKELTRVILSQRRGGSIYNPFAGLASYAIQLQYDCGYYDDFYPSGNIGDYYYGEELNNMAWAIGKLRLLAYEADSKNYIQGDSSQWRGGVANNILSTPPFGYQIINENGKEEYCDHFVIRRGIDMLADEGLLACVVPMAFLSRKDTADLRKRIVDEGLLESIVYLPENIFYNTSIRTAIIFIRKSSHNYVTLINAIDAIHGKNGKVNVLDIDLVANLLRYSYYPQYFEYNSDGSMEVVLPETKFERLKEVVPNERLAKANYDFIPGRYFVNKVPILEGYKLSPLKNFVDDTPELAREQGQGKVIRPSMLSKDDFKKLSIDNLSEESYRRDYRVIDRSALLFSPLGPLRPTLFINPNGEKAYYKPDTLHAVYLKDNAIIPEYLIIELNKPYVQEQIRLLAKGVIPRLGLNEFLSISLYIPYSRSLTQTLVKEKDAVNTQKALFYSKINAELVSLKDKQHDDYVKMLRQRKHRIQQVMNEFLPAFSMLNQLRKENGGILHDSDIVAARTGKTVGDYFDKLESIVAKVEDLVTNLIDKELWKEPKPVDIVQFINSIPKSHISDRFVFQIDDGYVKGESYEGIIPFYTGHLIMIDPDDLSTIFDNIINNALKYGFTETIRNDYVVRVSMISYMIDNDYFVRISVSNNGNPIHASLERGRFFDWGYGSNTGIGTWQIKSIVEHYGGSVELNEFPNDVAGFQTEYVIYLPLIKTE